MSDDHVVGHCGKILPRGRLCYPSLCDDLCIGCRLNGHEFEEKDCDEY